jgi:hypothetical protein
VDERTLSLIKVAREADAGAKGSKSLGTELKSSDDDSDDDDLEDDVLGSITMDWRAKQ